jgi:hypothetical protein
VDRCLTDGTWVYVKPTALVNTFTEQYNNDPWQYSAVGTTIQTTGTVVNFFKNKKTLVSEEGTDLPIFSMQTP